ncbi:MAG: Serine/alanine racemase [Firmicutes bacterium ADurb.Bin300]|nr:MAG: Serine/alanine racemase [Firmicutes bacterium ADurb.Bin300]HOD02334.1 acyltransferase [Clostridiales bacterium]
MLQSKKKPYKAIDVAKLLAATLIIMLHTEPFADISPQLQWYLRSVVAIVAVPFFFIASGFLLFASSPDMPYGELIKKYKTRALRIIKMYLLWSLIYFVFVAIDWAQNGVTVLDILQYIKRFFFEGSYHTIWFLPALAVGLGIVVLLKRFLSVKAIFAVGMFVYIFTICGTALYGFFGKLPIIGDAYSAYYSFFDSMKNGFFVGFPYISMGAIIATKKEAKQNSVGMWTILSAVFFTAMSAEAFLEAKLSLSTGGVDNCIMLAPMSYCLFNFVLSIKAERFSDKLCKKLRTLSILMFLSQRIFITIGRYLSLDTRLNSLVWMILIFSLTVLFSEAIIKLSEKVSFLKILY